MAVLERSKLFASPKMDSRIKSANVTGAERGLGYFASPLLIYMAYYTMSGTYLNKFYIDVVKLGGVAGGAFLVLLPVLSKIVDAVTNLLMGVIIDRTKTRQGKARPWLLISAPLLMISGILLYWIPKMSTTGQAIWVAISYNLYFAFAFTIYNMSQMMLIPLSTRNTKQRDSLALFWSMGSSMIPGAMIYIIVPALLLPWMGADSGRWALVMGTISVFMLPGILLQYYFTKERISEDAAVSNVQNISLWKQIKTCFLDGYWIMYVLAWAIYQIQQNMFAIASPFYADWVLGTYNDGTTLTLLNAIGQAPLGLGVFLLWPIAKKFGKRRTMLIGMGAASIASLTMFFISRNFGAVLGLMTIKAFGMLPTYLFAAMMAETMDHIEWKNGYRCDGFTATINSVTMTIMTGLSTTIFNSGLKIGTANGYVEPFTGTNLTEIFSKLTQRGLSAQLPMESYTANSAGSFTVGVMQSAPIQNWIVICTFLIPAIVFFFIALTMVFFKVEDDVPQMSHDISERHRAEAEAKGEVYYSPEEKAAMEQEENDRIAEETRILELREKCAKKGLNFDEEEAKYQAKLAEKKAKEAARSARKNKQ